MPKFKVGQNVTWESTSAGSTVLKIGEVAAIVPAGLDFLSIESTLKSRKKFISCYGGGSRRKEESYAVLVPQNGTAKPKLYWPRTSALKLLA